MQVRMNMVSQFEYLIFTRELRQLKTEYRQCPNENIKQEIHNDIQLLQKAVESFSVDSININSMEIIKN